VLRRHDGPVILTPHHGEMAALSGLDIEQVQDECEVIAGRVACDLGAVVALKA